MLSDGDQFRQRRRCSEASICGDDRGIQLIGEFDIQRIYESQVVATLPCPLEKGRQKMALERSGRQPVDSRGDLTICEATTALESSES